MVRTVVVSRAAPARLARAAFLTVYWLLRIRLRVTGRSDDATRDRIFAVQAPLGLFAQLTIWGMLLWLLFAALFWSLIASTISSPTFSHALELSGSAMLTLGFDSPGRLSRRLVAFAAAGVGLTLLALVIAYRRCTARSPDLRKWSPGSGFEPAPRRLVLRCSPAAGSSAGLISWRRCGPAVKTGSSKSAKPTPPSRIAVSSARHVGATTGCSPLKPCSTAPPS